MRILYCNKYNFRFSGTESYLFDAMELMRTGGHQVALFSMEHPQSQPLDYEQHVIPYIDFQKDGRWQEKLRLGAHAIYSRSARERIRAAIRLFRPEVAHVRNIYHHISPSILWELKSQGVPTVLHVSDLKLLCPTYNMIGSNGLPCEKCRGKHFWHVMFEGCYGGGRARAMVLGAEAYFHYWLRTYKRCVDLIVAPSNFVKGKFVENGWSERKITVLPHFQQLPMAPRLHPGRAAPILYFGRLSAEKGVADLILAMSQAPDLQLIIAGEGPERPGLEELAATLKSVNVQFVGRVGGAALDELISGSQFTVFPSHAYETFGKSILESFAHGRPVVATDLGSRRELVQEGRTGLLYSAGDVSGLAAAMRSLQKHPELARAMGETARQMVGECHSPEKHFSALIGIYEQLAPRFRRAGRKKWQPCALPESDERERVAS